VGIGLFELITARSRVALMKLSPEIGMKRRKGTLHVEDEEEILQSFGDKCAFLGPEVEIKPNFNRSRKSQRLSSTGYTTATLPNGKTIDVEFEGKEIFTHRLQHLIEESTGLCPENTSVVKGGRILAASDCIKSGSRVHLMQVLEAAMSKID
jgi:hypothetical protein